MSTFPFYPPTSTTTAAASPPPPENRLSLHYAAVLSLAFLLLLSLLLLSYIFFRYIRPRRPNPNPTLNTPPHGITLPRSMFVAEEDEENEQHGVVGLDQAVINSYPKFPFVRGGGGESVCAICLCEYRDGEMLRMLPECKHWFHLKCVDEWLKLNGSCPVCRNSPLPTPLSTPLSEVVPLSLYADGRNRAS